jgi:15-hydroxyprostaglandin dehydrogenase (NAD)
LALATDLAQKGWKLAIVDLNTTQGEAAVAKLGEENTLFIKADVSKWEENVKFFKLTKERFGRVDFGTACFLILLANSKVAANAGIDDTQDLYVPSDGVTKPNLKTVEVDLLGPLYATHLALHYFRTNEPNTGGKVVITSSTAGLYGCPPQPQYGTAKFGCIGLARSMGENAGLQAENITVNAICPSFVPSGLAPPEMLKRTCFRVLGLIVVMEEKFPHYITPASTITKAFNMFLDDDSLSGKVAECVIDRIYLRDQHPVRYTLEIFANW